MDIQAYIATGIIEDYALGIATPEQCAEVEQLARQYPLIAAEIEKNRFTLLEYILQFEQEPPANLRDQVWEKLQALEEEDDDIDETTLPLRPSKQIYFFPRLRYAASWLLLAISVGVNVWLYFSWQTTYQAFVNLQSIQHKEKQQYAALQAKYQEEHTEMELMHTPDVRKISLKGTEMATDAKVWLYWNTKTQDVYLKVENLPPPPAGKEYQLWRIDDKEVMDAGMVTAVPCLCHMKNTPSATAFAITLEKTGGVPKAEGKMYALAKL